MPIPMRAALALVVAALAAGCGSGSADSAARAGDGPSATTPDGAAPKPTTLAPIPGVKTFVVEAGHREGTITYDQIPPAGGDHNPTWTRCGYYEQPVPAEMAVHALEHGAIWITYRPDLPADQVAALAGVARGGGKLLVSPWPEGLPAPLVITAWGRQLELPDATDPRLAEFAGRYINKSPEPNAPC